MSKSRKSIDEKQGSLFELIAQINAPKPKKTPPGRFSIVDTLRESIRDAIKASPLSRHQIAGEMSHLLDESITKAQLDSWTRETDDQGNPNRRHVPAEYLPAFCEAVESDDPVRILVHKLDCHLMPPKRALDAEIAKIMRRRDEDNKLLRRLKVLRDEVDKQ